MQPGLTPNSMVESHLTNLNDSIHKPYKRSLQPKQDILYVCYLSLDKLTSDIQSTNIMLISISHQKNP